jgi:aquaporin Z
MVLAIILFVGAVSGAHPNPAVSVAFALRNDFPWRRVPGHLFAQLPGAVAACLFLWAVLGKHGCLGATEPGSGIGGWQAMLIGIVLTRGLASTVLGTASRPQNGGALSALGVGGYAALTGLWAGPVSRASMNPARSFGPDLVSLDFSNYWIYVIGPPAGRRRDGDRWVLRGRDDARIPAEGRLGLRRMRSRGKH